MSTGQIWQTSTTSFEGTLELGRKIGHKLRGRETLALVSDLGGGKTAFVRGLAQGAGSNDEVTSPSFTVCNQYKANDLTIYHFDFYRLHEPGLIANELGEYLEDPKAVVVIEWSEIVKDILPTNSISVQINSLGDNQRQFIIKYPAELGYLIEGNN